MSRLRDIPALQANNSNLRQVIEAVREALQTFRGTRGDKLDTALTPRNINDGTFVGVDLSGIVGGGVPIIIDGGTGGGSDPAPDTTPAPTPTGFTATAGLSFIAISTDTPTYTQGHGHGLTRVYGRKMQPSDPLPVFADAVELFSYEGSFGAYPTDPGTSWRLWVTWITNDGYESVTPAGGVNGLAVATAQDPAVLLDLLEGEINFSHLFTDLSTPIQSIVPGQDEAAAAALRNILGLQAQADGTSRSLTDEARDRGTAINELRKVVDDGNAQLATRMLLLTAATKNDTAALVASVEAAYASADAALATILNTVAATAGENTAAIAQEITTRASQTGDLFAQYTVKTDLNGYVAGYGLASTANNATPFSEFGIRADRFFITPPTNFTQETTPTATAVGQIWRKPSTGAVKAWSGTAWIDFVVPVLFSVLTTRQVINGVTFEPGVYMDGANIVNLTATIANLGDAWITNGMVLSMSADKLTAGSLNVGSYIQSTVYNSTQGWKIDAAGNATFNNATVRGVIYASGGLIGGITIGSSSIQSDNFVLGVSGWRLTPTSAQLPATNIIGKITTDQLLEGAVLDYIQDYQNYSGATHSAGTFAGWNSLFFTAPSKCRIILTFKATSQGINADAGNQLQWCAEVNSSGTVTIMDSGGFYDSTTKGDIYGFAFLDLNAGDVANILLRSRRSGGTIYMWGSLIQGLVVKRP